MENNDIVTMNDIAKYAGVSQATVSRVLAGNTQVSPEKRRIVMEWVNKLGYMPNFSAQTLANKQSCLIGLIVPDIKNPFFFEIIDYLESEIKRHGYHLIITNSKGDEDIERYHMQSLKARQVDGLIIVPSTENSTNINRLKDSMISTVVITQPHSSFDSVCISHKYGGRLAANHFLSLGIDRILLVGNNRDDKFDGFIEVFKEKGIELPDDYLINIGKWKQDVIQISYNSIIEYFKKHEKDYISGIFTYNDLAAFGALHALKELGIKVPKDIAIIGFDDTFISKNSFPSLTSVSQPIEELARIAVELVFDKIHNKEQKKGPVHIELKPSLSVKESTTL